MTKKKRSILIAVVVVAAAAIALAVILTRILGGGSSSGSKEAAYVESVADLTGAADAGTQNRFMGVVESQETWDISLNSDQKVKEVYVSEGDAVEIGTQLFAYDMDELSLSLSQAKLELEEIDNEISNYNSQIKALTAEKAAASSGEQFNYTVQIQSLQVSVKQSEYNKQSKQLEIDKLQKSMDQSVVTSQIAGVVQSINENGETDDSGNVKPYMSILTTGDYRVKGVVNETNISELSEGQAVILRSRVDAEQTWTGTIESIDTENQITSDSGYYVSSDSTATSSKYPFYITLDSGDGLMLGQHLYVELDAGQTEMQEGIWLYSGYVVQEEDGSSYVWANNGNGKLEKRAVELGSYNEEMDTQEILSGLTTEDYIAWPMDGFYEGMATTVNIEEAYTGETDTGDMEDSSDEELLDDGMTDDGMIDDGMTDDSTVDDGMTDDGSLEEGTVDEGDAGDGADASGDDSADSDSSDAAGE